MNKIEANDLTNPAKMKTTKIILTWFEYEQGHGGQGPGGQMIQRSRLLLASYAKVPLLNPQVCFSHTHSFYPNSQCKIRPRNKFVIRSFYEDDCQHCLHRSSLDS